MPAPDPRERQARIDAALTAAASGGRNRVLDALGSVELDATGGAPLDELFLRAKTLYLRNHYGEAVDAFDAFDRRVRSERAPTWQRYQSAHHRMFSLFQLGKFGESVKAANEAESIIDREPELEVLRSDILAMHGHFREQRHDLRAAIGIFERAHRHAVEHGNAGRALTTASDLARLEAMTGDAPNGLRWSDESLRLLARMPDHKLAEAQIYNRRGMLLGMLDLRREALEALDRGLAIAREAEVPEAECDALYLRADQYRLAGRLDDAKADYNEAMKLGRGHGMLRHEASILRVSAVLAFSEGDRKIASEQMKAGLTMACGLKPPSPMLLLEFAKTLTEVPAVLGKTALLPAVATRLTEAAREAEDALFRKGYNQAEQEQRATRAVAKLRDELSGLLPQEFVSSGVTIDLRRGIACFHDGRDVRLQRNVIEVVRLLARTPRLTVAALADELGASAGTVERRLSRVRDELPEVLVAERNASGHKVYWLKTPGPAELAGPAARRP